LQIRKGWLGLAGVTFYLCVAFPFYLALVATVEWGLGAPALAALVFYVFKFESLRKRRQLRQAATLAMVTGAASCLSFAALSFFVDPDNLWWDDLKAGDWLGGILRALALLIPMTLVFSALKVRQATRPEPEASFAQPKLLGMGALYMAAVLFSGALSLAGLGRSRQPVNQAAAVRSLRTINTAMVTYESTYHNGFAPNLAALGPPPNPGAPKSCNAAGLIDEMLASGQKKGYIFEYKPGLSVAKPPAGCAPGAKSYSISARPMRYGVSGTYSYFTDQSRNIHSTYEDRPATDKDPPLES
jgi:hypothetical protein